MCKMWATETTWRIADEAMQVRGGRGYETAQSLAGRGEEADRGRAIPARLPHQHDFRRLERDHASVHCARSARSASQGRRRNFQHAIADVGTRQSDFQFRKILRELVSETVDSAAAPANIESLHADLRAHVDYAARTSKRLARGLFHAMARFGPKLDREQLLLSRFCRNRDGTLRHERDLFFRAIENRSRRTGGRSSLARELLLPLGASCASIIILPARARNADRRGYDLTQELLAGKHASLESGIV